MGTVIDAHSKAGGGVCIDSVAGQGVQAVSLAVASAVVEAGPLGADEQEATTMLIAASAAARNLDRIGIVGHRIGRALD